MRSGARTMVCLVAVWLAATGAVAAVETPAERFGFRPGMDRELIDYEQLTDYLRELAAASPRVFMEEVGRSALDRPMYVVFVSTEENLTSLDELREINRRLAIDPEIPEEERRQLVERGRVFMMTLHSMHSDEVGPAQSLPIWVHELATTQDPEVVKRLGDVVLLIIPTENPDGMDMVVEHYKKYLGTKYERSWLPGIYHRYVGHDNNRDFVTLSQPESAVVNRLCGNQWYPQVLVDKHQMGFAGPRYFVPEYHDPIAENVDEGIWNWVDVFGANLSRDMSADGLSGVASHWAFDDYWPGASTTPTWKGVIAFLTEAASCWGGTPVLVEPTELQVQGKGLAEYKKGVNLPDPWPGGWWRPADIVRYELSSLRSVLATASRHRAAILRFRNDLCRKEVEKGRTEAPFYYVLPSRQHDGGALDELVDLLVEHGVKVDSLTDRIEIEGRVFSAGDVVVSLAQPYRAFVKEVLEAQRYPVRRYTPGGEMIRPYDITSWSLPLHRGLERIEVKTRSPALEARLAGRREDPAGDPAATIPDDSWGVAYSANDNQGYRAAFGALAKGIGVSRTTEAIEIDGRSLPLGSFMVRGTTDRLREIVESTRVVPAVLGTAPAVKMRPVTRPRIALVETYFHDMDAGWTRYVFDSYGIAYGVVRPGELEDTDLASDFDVIVFPDASADELATGRTKDGERYHPADLPPEYRRPISKEGAQRLGAFLEAGGIVVSWQRSTALFLDRLAPGSSAFPIELEVPVKDISKDLEKQGLYSPAAFLRAKLLTDHPLTWGMPAETGVLSTGSPVFATSVPTLDSDRRVIATHPEREILLSGHLQGEEQLANKPIMVWLRVGKGQLVLYGFNPLFRASTPATYKLLFNALLLDRLEK